MSSAISKLRRGEGVSLATFQACHKQMGDIAPELLLRLFRILCEFGEQVGNELIYRQDDLEIVLRPLSDSFDLICRSPEATEYLEIDLPNGNLVHWDRGLTTKSALIQIEGMLPD